MSLRRRILVTVGITLAILVAAISLISSRLMLRSFVNLEQKDSLEHVIRADRVFGQMIQEVHAKSKDWSSWDDAYRFMTNGNEAFVKSNLNPASLVALHIDAILFTDLSGRLFKSQTVVPEKGVEPPMPAEIVSATHLAKLARNPKALSEGVSGFVRLSNGMMLVSIQPILTSEEKGPPRGWLVFGRMFASTELGVLRTLTCLDVSTKSLDDAPVSGDPVLVLAANKALNAPYVVPLNGQTIAGYSTLRDLNGKPNFLLSMRKPREIYRQGLTGIAQMTTLMIVAGLVFGAVLVFVLERFALARLAKLSAEVASIGDTSVGTRVTVIGRDEVSVLATKINEMLAHLHETEEQLQRNNANLEAANVRLELMATVDGLTGLSNHRAFQDRLGEAIERANRTGESLSLAMIDVDRFKSFNDDFGHQAGDLVLRSVAGQLKDEARLTDFVARYGGEEFVVILSGTDGVEAIGVAERLRLAVNNACPNGWRVTASFGIATWHTEMTREDFIAAADGALYESKRLGRNRTTHAEFSLSTVHYLAGA